MNLEHVEINQLQNESFQSVVGGGLNVQYV